MTKEEFMGKLQLCYFGDRNAFNEIVSFYDAFQDQINKAIEFIHSKEYQYGDLEQDVYDYNMGFDEVEDLLKILKGKE